jgi:hypothetical protein
MPTSTYVSLATITLASTDSEIIFSSIPATYRDLVVVVNAQGSATDVFGALRYNSDTGSNYSWVQMFGISSGTGSGAATQSSQRFVYIQNSTARVHGIAQIMDYSATDKHKTTLIRDSANASEVRAIAGRWANTAAINTVSVLALSGTFSVGSTFSLYGIE